MHGLPKLHKVSSNCPVPPFRPIVSSIGTYNYELANFLGNILSPYVLDGHCAKDTFTFISYLQKVSVIINKFMISFDVESLFNNKPLRNLL